MPLLTLRPRFPRSRIYSVCEHACAAAFLFSIAVYASSFCCTSAKQQTANETYQNLLTKRVSIINLIATPERFDGKQVFVDGILHHVFEDDTLYLDREMADHLVKTNGIGLVYNEKDLRLVPNKTSDSSKPALDSFHNKCVAVYGTFDAKDKVLKNVTVLFENGDEGRGTK